MAIPNHAEGPIVVHVNAAGTSATAKFNGSLGDIATATGADLGETLDNIVTAIAAASPWAGIAGETSVIGDYPLIVLGAPPRTPQPI